MGGYNGAGVYERFRDWTDDKAANIKIRADYMDIEMDGFAAALSNALCRDGQSTVTANLPMNNHKLTGLAAGTGSGDSVRYEQAAMVDVANIFSVAGTNRFINTTNSASVQVLRIEGDRATPADGDAAYTSLMLSDSGGTQTEFARITWSAVDVTDGTGEDGALTIGVITAGSFVNELVLTGDALYPTINDGLALGAATLGFSDAFFASGAVLNFNNGDVTVTHSANLLTVAGGGLTVAGALAADSLGLGTSGVASLGTVEVGHASDTTVSRISAGVLGVEGVALVRSNAADATSLMNTLGAYASTLASTDRIAFWDATDSTWKYMTLANFMTACFDAVFGSTKGMLLYRGTSAWAALAPA